MVSKMLTRLGDLYSFSKHCKDDLSREDKSGRGVCQTWEGVDSHKGLWLEKENETEGSVELGVGESIILK
jgi:hypothetical protein